VSEHDDSDEKKLDLEAWDAQSPPADFAEKVLARIRDEEAPKSKPAAASPTRARRWGGAGGAVAVLALAAAVALKVSAPPGNGGSIAKDRTEVNIGTRARAVLEPGAQVKWDGDDVVQSKGDVFYRVEPGARFRVHTPAGDVEVKGTCFVVKVVEMQKRDVKVGVVSAGLTALAFVAVYEGKVAASSASERVDVGPGETAQIGPDGAKKTGDTAQGQKAFDAKVASAQSADEPVDSANQNLVTQVSEYRSRLEQIAAQKTELEQTLKTTEEKLAAAQDGAVPRARSEFDLDTNDWAELAKQGAVKYRMPCSHSQGWDFKPEKLDRLGLAPQDGAVLKEAYKASHDRLWGQMKLLCVQALGTSPEIVEKIGLASCPQLIYNIAVASDVNAASEAHTQAAEIRAGMRPEPGANDKVHPVTKMFLLLTGANKAFEQDLAKTFGPDEAHRLAYSNDMCTQSSTWGGGKKRGEK